MRFDSRTSWQLSANRCSNPDGPDKRRSQPPCLVPPQDRTLEPSPHSDPAESCKSAHVDDRECGCLGFSVRKDNDQSGLPFCAGLNENNQAPNPDVSENLVPCHLRHGGSGLVRWIAIPKRKNPPLASSSSLH